MQAVPPSESIKLAETVCCFVGEQGGGGGRPYLASSSYDLEQFGGCRRGTTHTLGATTLVRHRLNCGGECLRIKGTSFEFCQGGVWIDELIPFNFVSLAARFPIAKYDCGGNQCREGSPYIRINRLLCQ